MAKTVNLQEIAKPASAAAAVAVLLQGFQVGDDIELTFWEDDTQDSLIPSNQAKSVQKIGTIEGEVVLFDARPGFSPLFSLVPKKTTPAAKSSLTFIIAFPQPGGAASKNVNLFLPDEKVDVFEGESWEVFVTVADAPDVQSPTTRLARVRRALSVQKGEDTYSHYIGQFCHFYHNGSTDVSSSGGYFHDVKLAIKETIDFIFIADWSFHPNMRLEHHGAYDFNSTIGAALIAHAIQHPKMVIAIHTWDHTNLGAADAQNDDGGFELDRIASQQFGLSKRPDNLLWKKSSRGGTTIGFSHHQKFVVMDCNPDVGRRILRAFIGGLDLTKGRVDFDEHPILPNDPDSAAYLDTLISSHPLTVFDDWYNAEFFSLDAVMKPPVLPRQPWHDIALRFSGPADWDLVREFVGRWRANPAGSMPHGDTSDAAIKLVMDKYIEVLTRPKDPSKPHHPSTNPREYHQQWEAAIGPWATQVIRSIAKEHWEADPPVVINMPDRKRKEFKWTYNGFADSSIHNAYYNAITQAESFVYIETQYFISSGSMWSRMSVSNVVSINLALRAVQQAKKGKPFHIYIVVPMFPEGSPSDPVNCAQRQFQWNTIRSMAHKIESESGKKAGELMSVFFLAKWHDLGGALPKTTSTREANVQANRRYQIYVHSKFMLIDDRFMIIGSANLNERSLNGARDSEIGVALWPSDDSTIKTCIDEARAFRREIWTEHLGPKFPPANFDDPSSPACVAAIRDAALENYKAFREGRFDASVHGHLCLWPLETDMGKDPVQSVSKAPELDGMIPDRPWGMSGHDIDAWRWHAPGVWVKDEAANLTDPNAIETVRVIAE